MVNGSPAKEKQANVCRAKLLELPFVLFYSASILSHQICTENNKDTFKKNYHNTTVMLCSKLESNVGEKIFLFHIITSFKTLTKEKKDDPCCC